MARIEAVVSKRRRLVLVLWVLALLAALPFAVRQEDGLTGGGFAVAGSDSAQVEELLQRGVPADQRGVVLGAALVRDSNASPADIRSAVRDLRRAVAATPGVTLPSTSVDIARYTARKRPRDPVLVPLVTSADEYRAPDVASDLRERLDIADGYDQRGVSMHLVGQGALWAGLLDLTKHDLRQAELLGFPAVALILLAVFGSIAAALLPLTVAALAVVITGALIFALSAVLTMNVYVTNMAMMIGIGVAVDYSLFVVVRYREELAAGRSPADARHAAMATSGVAVIFSGAAVVAALASLFVVDTAVLRSLALGAIVVVIVSVALTVTLLPLLLGAMGRRITPADPAASKRSAARWRGWAERVMRRPRRSLALASLALLALAAPAAGLVLGDGALRQFPSGNETRQGFDAAVKVSPVGRGSPVKVLAPPGEVKRVLAYLAADPEVKRAGMRGRTRDGRHQVIMAEPRHDGDSQQAKDLVDRIRANTGAPTLVGGNSAAQLDFDDEVLGSLWLVALITAGLTFAILAALLRSVVLPLKAIATNLLSVAAAFGVLTVVFVWGAFDGLLGWDSPGYVDTFTVPLIVAAVFGLSMDYEVFLLSRIRERYLATGDTPSAVTEALVSSARTITGAAAIMVAVFGVFVATGVPVIQQVGLGCAVAILLDATLVRLVLVPAAMLVLGRWNWWWPTRRAAVAAATAILAAFILGACGDSEPPDREPGPDRGSEPDRDRDRASRVAVASARVRVTPPVAGTTARPRPVDLDLRVAFRYRVGFEPPTVRGATIELPPGTGVDGSAVPACPVERLARRGPGVCPEGAVVGRGTVSGRADTAPARGEVVVVNGGPNRVWLYTVFSNPIRTEGVVRGQLATVAGDRLRLELVFPERLQTIGGVPIALRQLRLEAGSGRWLTTTACPPAGRWRYSGRALFTDGSTARYADQVLCRPAA